MASESIPRSGHRPDQSDGHQNTDSPDDEDRHDESAAKHVNWILPIPSNEQQIVEKNPKTENEEVDADLQHQESSAAKGRSNTYSEAPKDQNDDELRNEILRIFSQQDSSHPKNSHPENSSQPIQEARGRTLHHDRSKPNKSALRKGHVTIGGRNSISPTTNHEERQERLKKTEEAADHARRKAHWWSRSVDTSPEPPADGKSRKRRHSLYHTGGNLESGQTTPEEEFMDYVPKPDQYRMSGFSAASLLSKIRQSRQQEGSDDSEGSTPKARSKLFARSQNADARPSLSNLVQLSSNFGSYGYADIENVRQPDESISQSRDSSRSRPVSTVLETLGRVGLPWRPKSEEDVRIRLHVQETVLRQRYLVKLCRLLMQYGAPTHRLEEYMKMSSRTLDIEASFLYIPGCMIVSFDDSRSHTTEVKLVRVSQGVDLGKIRDTHDVYKDVVHDLIGVEEAYERLEAILQRKEKFNKWLRVLVYGLASVSVGPFAFSARWIDLPVAFALGCLLGFLQLIVTPNSDLYSNVFEIMAVIITSFLARLFGSIHNGDIFCFSSLAQSSIALILPGYTVLCGSLELQSRSIVAGSVRLVYAIIYSLFIGYGLTIGTAIYGAIDATATSETTCTRAISDEGYWFMFFVPLFAICLMIINQAQWKQMPMMTIIAFSGYVVSYFSSHRFIGNAQVTSTLAAFVIGVIANLYSRVGMRIDSLLDRPASWIQSKFGLAWLRVFGPKTTDGNLANLESQTEGANAIPSVRHGAEKEKSEEEYVAINKSRPTNYSLASAAMLPAIFVLVPSGLSVSGSLVQGIQSADELINSLRSNGSNHTSSSVTTGAYGNGLAFNVSYSVVQVAIGITVGLFIGSLVIYPLGKGGRLGRGKQMRSGLFSY